LTKFWQKQFCTVFFETRCICIYHWKWQNTLVLYGQQIWKWVGWGTIKKFLSVNL